jgi:hypothetical protein
MRRRAPIVALAALVLLLVGLRAYAPIWVQRQVNRVLDRNQSYQGQVGDVDLSLWRGAYSIDDVAILKRGGKVPVPFFAAESVDFSVEWRALFEGAWVGEVVFVRPQLNFVAGPSPARRQDGRGADWRQLVEDLHPMKIDRVEVIDGALHFRNFSSDPPVDVYLRDVDLVAHNLTNSKDLSADRVARLRMSATPLGGGTLESRMSFDPFAKRPSFDLDLALRDADLTRWNSLLRAYGKFDVERGHFSVYTELAANDGRFEGYLKPFLEDVDVLRLPEEKHEQSWFASLWEAIVGATAEVFQDQENERVATRIPIRGTVDDPDASFWLTLGNVVRNAFFESFQPRLEGSVGTK